mmetsp:Transcript_28720/g.59349  ORF Transcript_28720/g.59349 Transcript_28720/m.59349 type:complete len:81 (-) Transcript_28720:232-474(-)
MWQHDSKKVVLLQALKRRSLLLVRASSGFVMLTMTVPTVPSLAAAPGRQKDTRPATNFGVADASAAAAGMELGCLANHLL